MNIVGIGNALVDIVSEILSDESLVKLGLPKGSMTLIDEQAHRYIMQLTSSLPYTTAAGGSAANTINGLAKLGVETSFIGKIANDHIGELFRKDQLANNITPLLLHSDTLPTGQCTSFVSPCKERTMATFLGAASSLQPDEVHIPLCDLLYIEGYLVYNHDLIETAMMKAKEQGIKVALDLASYNVVADNLEFLKSLISKYVDIIFANEEEAFEYTGKNAEKSLEILVDQCEIAVVKLGARGSLVASGSERRKIGIIDATPRDKTGAGDLYASGFLYGLTKGHSLKICGDIGAILSSKVVEVMGPKMTNETWVVTKELVSQVEAGRDIVQIP